MSLQYLVGGSVDYTEGLEGSRFIVTNPNAKSTLNGHIPFVHLIVEGEAILETAATAAGNIHAQFQVAGSINGSKK
jgi:hypothetical protein